MLLGFLSFVAFAQAAPNTTYQTNLFPLANDTYDLGSTSPAFEWNNLFVKNLHISGTCMGSGCGGGGGSSTFGTTSLSAVAPLQYSQSPLAQFSITQAGVSTNGYLSSIDWNTFNSKQAALTATWPQILTGSTLTFGGLSTSTAAVLGNIPYFSGVNTFANEATGTISQGTGITVTGTGYDLGTGIIITNSGVTSNVAGTGISVSGATGAVTITNSGVISNSCSSGISCSGTNPSTFTNTGVTSIVAGTGISVSGATGAVTVTNTGSTFAWPFTPTSYGNATSSTIGFTNGILVVGSSTIVGNATTTGMHAFGSVRIPTLGVAAGTFLAVDPNGVLIATTTPQGTSGAFSPSANYGTVAGLPAYTYVAGVITEVASGALSVDGNNPTVGQRVLVKNESGACTSSSGACNNGLYDVTAAGSGIAAFVLTRDPQYNSSSNVIPGIVTYIISGATLNDDFWALTSASPITIGSTALNYTEVSGGGAAVTSVSNSDSTLTISPTAGAVVASLNLAHANTWSALQNFGNATSTLFSSTYASSTNYFGANLALCTGTNALTWSAGFFGCAAQPQGTVTAIGVTTNQGVSGSSSGGAAPNLTLTLGALTGVTSLNGLIVTQNTGVVTTGTWNGTTIAVANGGTNSTSLGADVILYNNHANTQVLGVATSSLFGNIGSPGQVLMVSNGSIVFAATSTSGGGGTPGGANGQFQFDNAGSFGGATNSTFSNLGGWASFGTTTLALISSPAQLIVGTSTKPQLLETDNSNSDADFFNRVMPGGWAFGTTSSVTFSTSTMDILVALASSTSPFELFGVGTTTPRTSLDVNGEISSSETKVATSSTTNIDWANTQNQDLVQIGASAITVQFTNYGIGMTKRVIVCNPTGTAGALTWGTTILWAATTTPTQTTMPNACDEYSFLVTEATSTNASNPAIFGTQVPAF